MIVGKVRLDSTAYAGADLTLIGDGGVEIGHFHLGVGDMLHLDIPEAWLRAHFSQASSTEEVTKVPNMAFWPPKEFKS